MDCAPALTVRIHSGSILVATWHRHIKIGAAIARSPTLTVETHRDSSRLVAQLSTLISSVAMIIRRRSPCWLTANRSSTRHAFSRQSHASADGSSRTHHRNSQRFESLRGRPIHMDRRHFDGDSPTLIVQTHGDSMVHTTRISATKSALRRILCLALTIKIHSDSSRRESPIHIDEGHLDDDPRALSARAPAARPSARCPSPEQNQCLGESTVSHSPSKFTAIRVSSLSTYPHR